MLVRQFKNRVSAGLLSGAMIMTLAGASLSPMLFAQEKAVSTDRNSKANGPTADNQKNDKEDLQMVKKIRQAIVQDKSLSTAAHNVKVVVVHGQVTLRGPVRSDAEKQSVEAKAAEVAGAGKVTNELTVAASAKGEKQAQVDASKK